MIPSAIPNEIDQVGGQHSVHKSIGANGVGVLIVIAAPRSAQAPEAPAAVLPAG